jgi:hypothetical protein
VAQDDASSTLLPGAPPKAKHLLLGEGKSLLWAHFSKAQEPGRRHPRDGRSKTVAAGREHVERAEDKTHGGVCVRSVKGAVLQELGLDRPTTQFFCERWVRTKIPCSLTENGSYGSTQDD